MTDDSPARRITSYLRALHFDGPRARGLAVLWLVFLLPCLGGTAAREALQYERGAIASGELWRLVTAHLVHFDLRHALLNGVGATLMWALFVREYAWRVWLLVIGASILAIDAGLWFRDPQVQWYVGASGVLHGVMAAGALAQLQRREFLAPLLVLALVVKLAYEEMNHALPFAGEMPVVTQAHLYGAAAGLVVAFVAARLARRRAASQSL